MDTFHLQAQCTTATVRHTRPRPCLFPFLRPRRLARNAILAKCAKRPFRAPMIANDTTTPNIRPNLLCIDAHTAIKASVGRIHSSVIKITDATKKSLTYRVILNLSFSLLFCTIHIPSIFALRELICRYWWLPVFGTHCFRLSADPLTHLTRSLMYSLIFSAIVSQPYPAPPITPFTIVGFYFVP